MNTLKTGYFKIKNKWKLQNAWQVFAVLLTFSISGFSVVYFREFLFQLLGFGDNTSFWVKAGAYLLFVFPVYQSLLLMVGWVFGQFSFFWKKEKKLFYSIKKAF